MTKSAITSNKPRKQHSPEFRQEALKLAERIGVAAAARELSLYESQLYAWRSKLKNAHSSSEREQKMAGTPGGCAAISQTDASSSVWSVMPLSGRHSVTQNSGMVHRVWQMNCRNTTSKPSPPACVVRAFGQKPHGSSGWSATVSMVCRYQRTC